MNLRKYTIHTGSIVLGIALCAPVAILAQASTPPQESQGVAVPQPSTLPPPPMGQGMGKGMGMGMGHPPKPKRQLKHMTRMLNLTPDQQHKMLPMIRENDKQMRAIRDNSSLSPQQRHQQMRALMMDTHQKMESVMTDTQKQQFDQKMQAMRHRMQDGGMQQGGMQAHPQDSGNPPPPGGPAGQGAPPPQN